MEDINSRETKYIYSFGPFRLNAAERRLTHEGQPVRLTRKAFDLLLILVAAGGHLKTREELIEALWPHNVVEEQGLTTRIYALRKALGDDGDTPIYLETVRGIGYRFIAPVAIEMAAPAPAVTTEASDRLHRGKTAGVAAVVFVVVAGILIWRFVPWGAASKSSASPPSIAVLPFENLSADKANAYFAAGIRDTILSRLAGLGDLRVVSRSASDAYPSRPGNLGRVGQELRVKTVLEGSVQKAGNQVLINVQLIAVGSDTHIWAATYTRGLADIFKVEGEVATEVAEALQTRLRPAERARLARAPTRDPETYLLYLKANYNASRAFDLQDAGNADAAVARATALYRQAIARDPAFALAWARLSQLDSTAWWYGIDATPKRKNAAREAAERAIALDPTLPQAHIALGYAYYYGAQNYAAALHQFRLAREALPYSAEVIGAMAYIHRRQGQWKAALDELARAAALDPRNPRWHDETATTLMALRRYPEAMRQFNLTLAVAPRDYDAKGRQITLLLCAGKIAQAEQELATIPSGADPQGIVTWLHFETAWLAHKPDAALAAIAHAGAWIAQRPTSLLRADVAAFKGEKRNAALYYEKAREDLQTKLRAEPDNPVLWKELGLAEAGLGDKAAALVAGRHAATLYPITRDVLLGPNFLVGLAKIHARLDEAAPAIKLLAKLLAIPAGREISVPLLRLDPVWDPIRRDPAFQALLRKYGTQPPAVFTAATGTATGF